MVKSWLSCLACLTTCLSLGIVEQTYAQNQYPSEFVTSYLQDCQTIAEQEGLTPEDAKTVCNCTINKFQSQYTLDQYEQLTPEVKEEIGYACFEEILYAE